MPQQDKRYLAKLFKRDGASTPLNIPHDSMRGMPVFTDRINGGMGECVIDYIAPFDDFGEGTDIDHQFILDVWCFDEDNPLGRRIYRGAVQEFTPYIKGAQQGVLISALGLGSNLSYDAYMASSRTVYTVTHTTVDPETIFKAIIDEWRAFANNALIDYEVGSTQTVGTNVTKEFEDTTWFDACEETRELCPEGWWWHIDADGIASLLPKPTTPTHSFIIGKHIEDGQFPKSVKSTKNHIRVTRNGGTVTEYEDATSIADYESRLEIVNDTSLGDANAADQAGNNKLGQNKDPKNKNTLIINSEYDIESIKVGQTCKILNVNDAATFVTNSQIVGLSYEGTRVTLELEESAADMGLALEKIVNAG
jgi:hypothetical protein